MEMLNFKAWRSIGIIICLEKKYLGILWYYYKSGTVEM